MDANHSINNCFDSHVHLLATGQVASGLDLSRLNKITDLIEIKKKPEFYRGEWLVGFGWDQHRWNLSQHWPSKHDLDTFFTEPVYFSRIDGHTGWFNSAAEKKLIQLGFNFKNPDYQSLIIFKNGEPDGILKDHAHIEAMTLLPNYSVDQEKSFLQNAGKIFNQAGFTHIRDMSSTVNQWSLLDELQMQKKLFLCVEGNITIEGLNDLSRGIQDFLQIKQNKNPFLRAKGLKVFVDGSLGSKTAALSENYVGENHSGQIFWNESAISEVIKAAWSHQAEVSFHTIGDHAVDLVVRCARQVSAAGLMGRLNLEHVELLRLDTLQMMKPLHVVCHMQPCHWLTDKTWLPQVLSKTTQGYLFQWKKLRKNKIAVQFGSDSPIEKVSLLRNFIAVKDAAKNKIQPPIEDLKQFHAHPDQEWTKSVTQLSDEKIVQVRFDNQVIFES